MLSWKIFYGDGNTFSSDDGSPADAPGCDIQAIVQADPDVGRFIVASQNYYVFDNSRWRGVDIFGLWYYLVTPGYKVVKFGVTIDNHDFREIYQRAKNDPDFPRKSGYRPGERRVE